MKVLGIILISFGVFWLLNSISMGFTTYDLSETRDQGAFLLGIAISLALMGGGWLAMQKTRKPRARN